MENDLHEEIKALCESAKNAAPALAAANTKKKNDVLLSISVLLEKNAGTIIEANAVDLENAKNSGIQASLLDRLMLDLDRINGIRASLAELVLLADPIGSGTRTVRPNGLVISCSRVPLGCVGIIYESRPNVTVDAASLCVKTGNAVILRGGKEAIRTNIELIRVMKEALEANGLPPAAVSFVSDTTRASASELMSMRGYLDVHIPRGGRGLIRSVVENAKVPVIETGAGNCHLYIDESADLDMAVRIAVNAKTSRPSVCNAIETLLVHSSVAEKFLPAFAKAATDKLEIRGCERTRAILPFAKPATEEDYATEFDDMILAVRVVDSIGDAIAHIRRYTTGHSEAVVTRSLENAERFKREIDAAAVYVNASTRFTDGGEFGFGAEIGISTQKLHVRGPMGLMALTTVKYLVDGDGQIR